MTTKEQKQILDRVEEVYDQLVDETENPMTHRSQIKNQRLNDLLELFEYLLGTEGYYNPIPVWFEYPEDKG